MRHRDRSGRVRRQVLEQDLRRRARRASPPVGAGRQHLAERRLPERRREPHVDEPRPSDRRLAERRLPAERQSRHDRLGDRARLFPGRLGQRQRHVGGEVAMLRPLGPIDRHGVAGHGGDEPFARQIIDRPDQNFPNSFTRTELSHVAHVVHLHVVSTRTWAASSSRSLRSPAACRALGSLDREEAAAGVVVLEDRLIARLSSPKAVPTVTE